MKHYKKVSIEILNTPDVVTTSGVLTGGVDFPWAERPDAYNLARYTDMKTPGNDLYETD